MPKTSYAIGIDLGGTTVKSALVDKKGKIIQTHKISSRADEGPEAVIGQIHHR